MSNTLISALVAILSFITLACLGLAFTGDPGSARAIKRTQAITRNRSRDLTGNKADGTTPEQRRAQIIKSLKDQERQTKKASLSITARMVQAGLPEKPEVYWMICAGVGLAAAAGTLTLKQPLLVILAAAFGGGFGLPIWGLRMLRERRMKKFTAAFPDAMDMIVRGIKSGMPLQDCLRIIGNEGTEPLRGEFKRMKESLGMGISFEQALEKCTVVFQPRKCVSLPLFWQSSRRRGAT